ncbi:MAG: biotin--[acetyl-CoA-carboxylase] ligase [Alphaproteobacteria bacterium]|nr:biotin--[acetyl-CoA-carboxylase] ligase [Alphaproteobacteria bacterium]
MTQPTATPGLPGFFDHVAFTTVASTNDEALARAADGAPEGVLITARTQTAGRGRRGRAWESAEGNLFLSLILRPEGGAEAAAALGFAAALAIADTLEPLLPDGADIALKWPNDVLIGRRKVSGLLIERAPGGQGAALVLGVGVNLASHPGDTPYPATDLAAEGGGLVSANRALAGFCEAFLARYRAWQRDGFGPLRAAWLARVKGIGGPIAVEIEGARFDGVFRGIDDAGALCLDLGAQGMKKVTAGDVYFTGPAGEDPC